MLRQQQDIKPRFEVHDRMDETVVEKQYKRDSESQMNIEVEVEVPYGYDVFFPNGSSMRVRTLEELISLGYEQDPGMIDMQTGEAVPAQTSLRQAAQRRGKKSRADTSAVGASEGDS